jgi:hypothetical protein
MSPAYKLEMCQQVDLQIVCERLFGLTLFKFELKFKKVFVLTDNLKDRD